MYDVNHMINVKHVETLFGMCAKCKLGCVKKCSGIEFEEKDYFIERMNYKPLKIYQLKRLFSFVTNLKKYFQAKSKLEVCSHVVICGKCKSINSR